jgi:hypothetical protein
MHSTAKPARQYGVQVNRLPARRSVEVPDHATRISTLSYVLPCSYLAEKHP